MGETWDAVDISLFRSVASQYQDLRSTHAEGTTNAISTLIEEQVLNQKLAVDFYSGVQRFSKIATKVPQYIRLGSLCRRVFVFGVADVEPPAIAGVEFIEIENGASLAKERFVLVDTANFWTTLLTREIPDSHGESEEQYFDGLWSYDIEVVERVSLLVSQVMGSYYNPVKKRNYASQSAHIAEINRRLLKNLEAAELSTYRRAVLLSTIHQFTAVLLQHNPLPCVLRDAVPILSMIFGAKDTAIALNMHGKNYMVVSATGNVSKTEQISQLGEGISSQAISEGKVIAVADVRHSNKADPLLPTAKTLLAVPIKGSRRIYGAVVVGGSEPNQWHKEDMQTIVAIASILAVIIEQKAQISSDVIFQIRRARQIEQIMSKLRKPVARLDLLRGKLYDEGNLSPMQKEAIGQIDNLCAEIADILQVPRTVGNPDVSLYSLPDAAPEGSAEIGSKNIPRIWSNLDDSDLSPPPAAVGEARLEIGSGETVSAAMEALGLGADPSDEFVRRQLRAARIRRGRSDPAGSG
ncbi:MAG: GAF domain-containing protein [Oscillatoria sp. SIO1A7]|nr:GAF domain-containing protein [Oscillatoria sp. SIO1A7]